MKSKRGAFSLLMAVVAVTVIGFLVWGIASGSISKLFTGLTDTIIDRSEEEIGIAKFTVDLTANKNSLTKLETLELTLTAEDSIGRLEYVAFNPDAHPSCEFVSTEDNQHSCDSDEEKLSCSHTWEITCTQPGTYSFVGRAKVEWEQTDTSSTPVNVVFSSTVQDVSPEGYILDWLVRTIRYPEPNCACLTLLDNERSNTCGEAFIGEPNIGSPKPSDTGWETAHTNTGILAPSLPEDNVLYYVTYVYSPIEQDIRLKYKHDDNLRIWINDRLVVDDLSGDDSRQAGVQCLALTSAFEFESRTHFRKGSNRILVRLGNGLGINVGASGFYIKLTDLSGNPLQNIKVYVKEPLELTVNINSLTVSDTLELTMTTSEPNREMEWLWLNPGDDNKKCALLLGTENRYWCNGNSGERCVHTWEITCEEPGTYTFKGQAKPDDGPNIISIPVEVTFYSGDEWDVVWYNDPKNNGFFDSNKLGRGTDVLFSGPVLYDFKTDFGKGVLFNGRKDDIGLQARRSICFGDGNQVIFELGSDDGSKLYMDDDLKIDNWGDHSYSEKFFEHTFAGSSCHNFLIEYYEKRGNARIHFRAKFISS